MGENFLDIILPPSDEDVWLEMWHTAAGRKFCHSAAQAAQWADEGLTAYKLRFVDEVQEGECQNPVVH